MSDPYGAMLIDAVEGRAFEQEIIELDDGFFDTSTIDYYLAPVRRWDAVERRALRYVRGRVLDVGCGAGRVALERKHAVGGWLRSILLPERWRSPVGVASETFASCDSKMWTRPSGGFGTVSRTEVPLHLACERRNRRLGRMPGNGAFESGNGTW